MYNPCPTQYPKQNPKQCSKQCSKPNLYQRLCLYRQGWLLFLGALFALLNGCLLNAPPSYQILVEWGSQVLPISQVVLTKQGQTMQSCTSQSHGTHQQCTLQVTHSQYQATLHASNACSLHFYLPNHTVVSIPYTPTLSPQQITNIFIPAPPNATFATADSAQIINTISTRPQALTPNHQQLYSHQYMCEMVLWSPPNIPNAPNTQALEHCQSLLNNTHWYYIDHPEQPYWMLNAQLSQQWCEQQGDSTGLSKLDLLWSLHKLTKEWNHTMSAFGDFSLPSKEQSNLYPPFNLLQSSTNHVAYEKDTVNYESFWLQDSKPDQTQNSYIFILENGTAWYDWYGQDCKTCVSSCSVVFFSI
jgi:hypothetical protein